jgi:8-amino-7-oxononanoate synthase
VNEFEQYFSDQLNQRRANGNYRSLSVYSEGIDFLSNDYLSWASSKKIDTWLKENNAAFDTSMAGSTGSRLMSGNHQSIEALEKEIAALHEAEAALIFNSGYNANLGLIQAISDRNTTLVCDALVHASLLDATRLAHTKNVYKFQHNDLKDLDTKLTNAEGKKVVVVESVYSMDGDAAPLDQIVELCRKHQAVLVVDEAHALGVCGSRGLGLCNPAQWNDVLLARVYTFGKAMACHGAAVLGSELLRQYLINFARPFIYTTALSPHAVACIEAAYKLLSKSDVERSSLQQNIAAFRVSAEKHGVCLINSFSAIQCLIVGTNQRTKRIADGLNEAGFLCKAILHPTVPEGTERIRFCLQANHDARDYGILFEKLKGINEN